MQGGAVTKATSCKSGEGTQPQRREKEKRIQQINGETMI